MTGLVPVLGVSISSILILGMLVANMSIPDTPVSGILVLVMPALDVLIPGVPMLVIRVSIPGKPILDMPAAGMPSSWNFLFNTSLAIFTFSIAKIAM